MTPGVTKNSHAFCGYCGVQFGFDASFPRTCGHCGNTTFRNPIPVIAVLCPFYDGPHGDHGGGNGLIVIRRAIQPSIGELALPGGYMDFGETWQRAAARELWEETGIDLRAREDEFHSRGIRIASNGNLLIFVSTPVLRPEDLPDFVPNHECSERRVIFRNEADTLCFSTHREMAANFFNACFT